MSILLFACIDFPNGPATTAHCNLMVKGICKNGVSSFLIIPFGTSNRVGQNHIMDKGHYYGVPYIIMSNKYDIHKSFRWINNIYGMIKSALLLYKRWRKHKQDIVIIYSTNLFRHFLIICFCLLLKIPLYPWEVEKESSNREFKGIKFRFSLFIAHFTEILLPKIAEGMIVISSYLNDYYGKYIPKERIILSPILVNPVDYQNIEHNNIDSFRKKYNGKKIILYSGLFAEKDGISYILEAMNKFVSVFPDSILLITGKASGKYYLLSNIDNVVDALNLKNNFQYLGFVSREELKIIKNAADLLLVCRSNSIYANIGFPWKLGEYCMTAKPIIATKVGDIEKYFKDKENIFLADPEDSISIFLQMKIVFDNYPKALEVAQKGYEKACTVFNYQIETKRIINFVNKNLN
jgi:glycosyltransferase involved in cell wall biosynthesis